MMFRRLGDALRRFMYGRYGWDSLNVALMIAVMAISIINSILSLIFRHSLVYTRIIYPLVYLLMMALLTWCVFRCLSRSIYRRQQENRAFQRLKARLTDRRNRYYRCPKCRQTVRVPRGKGKISIRCPKCGERFIRKT